MNFLEAAADEQLFGSWYRNLPSRKRWLVWIASICALPLSELAHLFGISAFEAMAIYTHHTGRSVWPSTPAREAWNLSGRRAGKTSTASDLALWFSCFRCYDDLLAPGERAVFMFLAADKRQARQAFHYVEGRLDAIPILSAMVERKTTEAIDLSNRVSFEIHVSSYRSVRGYTLCGVVADEIAFWRDDTSSNPDVEVLNALRPAMVTIPNAPLIAITTPYARRGAAWKTFRDYFGRDHSDVHVWRGSSVEMNPTISQGVIDRAMEADPAAAAAEWMAQFRTDIESFISREAVDAVVVPGRLELPPVEGVRYFGFCDPSGGSSDSMTLAVAHTEGNPKRAVLDLVREVRPPFSPEVVVEEFAETLRRYRIGQIRGDRYAAEWCAERFRKAGITYKPAEKAKSDLYRELLPAINAQTVELLDHPKLIAQLCSLERRTARGGRDSIDHPPKAHDDIANVCAGAVHLVLGKKRGLSPHDLYGAGGLFYDEDGKPRRSSRDDWDSDELPTGIIGR
jgi:hypothetical protein